MTAKWTPTERLGLSLALREDMYGKDWTPLIPAFYADYMLTLNDLYFQPGGNPDLQPEHGFTYDGGVSFAFAKEGRYAVHGEATWFDSYIDDWILWIPLGGKQDFWTPKNLKKVHAYGVELKAGFDRTWNRDESIGKQLVYVPEFSASVTARLAWKSWRLLYKWCWYSERFTMSSNDYTISGYVPPYLMSDMSVEKLFAVPWADFSVKIAVKNLFNEEYLSVLARPMPRLNFEIFLDIRPKWGKKR